MKSKQKIKKQESNKEKEVINNVKNELEILNDNIQNKKARKEFEKQVDLAQARIWEQDYQNYIKYQNETNKRILELNQQFIADLEKQAKNGNKYYDYGMSDAEKELNKDLLEKANV